MLCKEKIKCSVGLRMMADVPVRPFSAEELILQSLPLLPKSFMAGFKHIQLV